MIAERLTRPVALPRPSTREIVVLAAGLSVVTAALAFAHSPTALGTTAEYCSSADGWLLDHGHPEAGRRLWLLCEPMFQRATALGYRPTPMGCAEACALESPGRAEKQPSLSSGASHLL